MARPLLALYALDQGALDVLGSELRALLNSDDRSGVAALLGLGEALAQRLASRPAIEWFLRTDDDPDAAPFHASLRRIAKKRALEQVWSSEHPSLEGRLRAYDTLRGDLRVAAAIDRALDPAAVPFYLGRKGATCGVLRETDRCVLVDALGAGGTLRDEDLPAELAAFGDALSELESDLLVHDAL